MLKNIKNMSWMYIISSDNYTVINIVTGRLFTDLSVNLKNLSYDYQDAD